MAELTQEQVGKKYEVSDTTVESYIKDFQVKIILLFLGKPLLTENPEEYWNRQKKREAGKEYGKGHPKDILNSRYPNEIDTN